jgi:hypothetical protein
LKDEIFEEEMDSAVKTEESEELYLLSLLNMIFRKLKKPNLYRSWVSKLIIGVKKGEII